MIKSDEKINFKEFNLLSEKDKIACMEQWTSRQRLSYLLQNTISEEECFGPIFKLIDEIEANYSK